MVDLIALKAHRYAGRLLAAGERYSAKPMDARLFKACRLAVDAPPLEVPKPKGRKS